MPKTKEQVKRVKGWAGIVDGKIDKHLGQQYGHISQPTLKAIFTKKWEATARYQKVVEVEITYKIKVKK